LLTCEILNFAEESGARRLAKSVIKSSLVKTMVFGADANCGRILCALGYSGVEFDPNCVDVKYVSSAGAYVDNTAAKV
jgi:glutamate N-acetyltransferase/amino-acid N-acetyltransferase